MILYAALFAKCTTEIFELTFGPKTPCNVEVGTDVRIPEGIILTWDPIVRDADGSTTGKIRLKPTGWVGYVMEMRVRQI